MKCTGNSLSVRRTSIQVIADILSLAVGQAVGKTAIMYGANMSHAQLEKYLSYLESRGFLKCSNGSRLTTYHTTEVGSQLLEDINKMTEVLGLEAE